MTLRLALRILFGCCLVGMCVPLPLGLTYTDRLASRPSEYLVHVDDAVPTPDPRPRPRRTVVVVLDGLGYKEALGMRTAQLLRERGQCWKTNVSPLPMSRAVYAVLSTGVEQDRGGPLTNDATSPHAAESIWEIARGSGMTVAAVSELSWWKELFPRGFTSYLMPSRSENYFQLAPGARLTLIHPLYIDETGHLEGAGSTAYAEAVARADGEILDFMKNLDLSQDLLIVTADHGHSLSGGHGGDQDRVANVLSCFAGLGVQKNPTLRPVRMTALGPALTLLMGLNFPTSMRAGDDDLAALWELVDPATMPAGYLAERQKTVERFRAVNREQVAGWAPSSGGSWAAFYTSVRRHRELAGLAVGAVFILLLGLHRYGHRKLWGRGRDRLRFLFGLIWLVGFTFAAYALQSGLRGSFDMSSINNREGFIRFTLSLGVVVSVGALSLHLVLRRSLRALAWELSILSIGGTLLCLAQPLIFGWHLSFPVPPPPVYFFPFFAALFLSALNGIGLILCLVAWVGLRRRHKKTAVTEKPGEG
jgi:hypothetical protein